MKRKKLQHFDGSLVTEKLFPQHVNAPDLINGGTCFVWAYAAKKLFRHVEVWDVQNKWSHAFVYNRRTKKFYDSECPNGVKDWLDLPAVRYCGSNNPIAYRRTLPRFVRDWKETRKMQGISWYEIDQKIDKILQEKHEQVSL